MGGQQGAGVHGGEVVRVQGGMRRRRRKRRRVGDGARRQQLVVVGIDGWGGSAVFTHTCLRIHNSAHPHQGVDERQPTLPHRVVKQGHLVLRK